MAANKVKAGSGIAYERSTMGPMNTVWFQPGGAGFGFDSVKEDPNLGILYGTNFMSLVGGAIIATGKGNYWSEAAGFHSLEGGATAGSVATLATDLPVGVTGSLIPPGVGLALGAIELATGAAAHNSCAIEFSGGAAGASANGMFGLPPGAAVTAPSPGMLPKLFFETRVRFPQTANASVFLGLCVANKTSAQNTIFNASDVFQTMNFIGFVVNAVASTGFATSATQIQAGYGISGTTPVIAGTSAVFTAANTGGIPSTANYVGAGQSPVVAGLSTDWTKLGFVVDAVRPDGILLKFYQDGILLGQLTQSQMLGSTNAASWPSNVPLTPTIYVQSTGAGGATAKLDLDYLYAGQIVSLE